MWALGKRVPGRGSRKCKDLELKRSLACQMRGKASMADGENEGVKRCVRTVGQPMMVGVVTTQ